MKTKYDDEEFDSKQVKKVKRTDINKLLRDVVKGDVDMDTIDEEFEGLEVG